MQGKLVYDAVGIKQVRNQEGPNVDDQQQFYAVGGSLDVRRIYSLCIVAHSILKSGKRLKKLSSERDYKDIEHSQLFSELYGGHW